MSCEACWNLEEEEEEGRAMDGGGEDRAAEAMEDTSPEKREDIYLCKKVK